MKYSYSDIHETCTYQEYISQFNPIKLELGKVYVQNEGKWDEMRYKIIFIDDKIALGLCVYNAISMKFIGHYELFSASNGFKYQDTQRPSYRLTRELNP